MSQEEIFNILKKGKPLTRAELQELTDLSNMAICHALKQLMKQSLVIKSISIQNIPIYEPILKRKKKKKRERISTLSQK